MPGNAQALGMKGLERKRKKRSGKERKKREVSVFMGLIV